MFGLLVALDVLLVVSVAAVSMYALIVLMLGTSVACVGLAVSTLVTDRTVASIARAAVIALSGVARSVALVVYIPLARAYA
ncbi:MAG: hypothetical protein AB7K09_10015 [Planctomycetota bacterium]